MENLTNHGASLLGQRLGALVNGIITAHLTLFFDWVTPSWCKIAYVVIDHLYRASRSDKSLVASKSSLRARISVYSIWLSLSIAYLIWAPKRRLIMIYHGLTGHGGNLILWSWIALQNDGPRNSTNRVHEAFLDATITFLISSYSLTHRALVWGLIKWAFIRLMIPVLLLSVVLYYFQESLPLARTYYQVRYYVFRFISKAYNAFDYVEAQLIERLPQYLQHEWSLYQQRRPKRARLPTYQYRPLNAGDFRLFILKKSSFYPSVIHGEIIHTPIHPPPDYEAVSYRWGSPETTEEIIVDGFRLRVTKSAFDLLLARRSVWRERRIWIDAICINQKDVQEKSEQVQLMRHIYHRASRVISFPGGGWRNRLAGAFVYELWSLVYQYNSDAMNWSATPNEATTLRWRAMADLFSNEYFNRAWVIQEIAVGKKTELYVGGIYLPWMAFAEVVDWCFHYNRRHMLSGSYDKERRVWRTGRTFENIAVMTTLRPEAEGWTGEIGSFSDLTSLEKLIYITFNFEAADPRDKVYGLMGIARNTGDLTLAAPDYSLPAEQVFKNVTRAIFSLPTERKTIHILAIAGTGFSERSRPMPSWVPDFSEGRICYPYATVLKTDTCFRASGDILQDVRLEDETDSLIVKAMKIDRVLELSAFGALDWKLHDLELTDVFKTLKILHGFVHAAIDLYKKHAISPGTTDESTHERLWSAFIAGRVERKPADVKFKEVFQHWLHHLDLIVGARDRAHYNRLIKEGALGDGWVFTNDGTETTYQHSVMEACFGRRIAVTVSGRLCIVPPLTKVGDSVIIPLGSQTPFLIRQCHDVPESIGDELVGEAWVEGVMQGEMIGNADEELIRIS